MHYQFHKKITAALLLAVSLVACNSSEVGEDEDDVAPVITLTSLNTGEEVIGTFSITWDIDEENRSTVDIELSTDSGLSFPHEITVNEPDTGSYSWDSNITPDCRSCRIRITASDIVGNISITVTSAMNFIVNNVPQVLGSALFYDFGTKGVGDTDQLVIPFDKEIELRTSVVGNVFILPVVGDEIGPFSTMALGSADNKLIITINDLVGSNFHMHLGGLFSSVQTNRTAPTGLDILENISGDIIFAKDTGRTAEPVGDGIDIAPTFGDPSTAGTDTGSVTQAVALGDLNGDGTQDLVAVNENNSQFVYSNDGTGLFSAIGSQTLGMGLHQSVALGDINNNGSLDIIVGSVGANGVYTNNGSGTFTLVQSPGSNNTSVVVLGDIDGNTSLDLITGNSNQPNRVWRNNGSGNFSEDGMPQTLGNYDTADIVLGDIDGDTDLDIVESSATPNTIRFYINGGVNSGNFTETAQTFADNGSEAIALGDIDNDDDLDLVSASRVYFNNGSGTFVDSNQVLGSGNILDTELYDYDRDGDLDLIAGTFNDATKVWLNNGAGIFVDSGMLIGANATRSITLGDVDGDGDTDLVEGNNAGSGQVLWRNSMRIPGQTIMLDTFQTLGDSDTRSIAKIDVDGDGDLDFVTGNFGQGNQVWINTGDGQFTDSGQSLGSSDTWAVALGDVNGDNFPDMVDGTFGGGVSRIWSNDGNGNFSDSGNTAGTNNTESLVMGDVDDDGDLDIISGYSDVPSKLWTNSGINSGVFVDSMQALCGGAVFSVVLGDVDGDTDLDLVCGIFGASNQVWTNDGIASGNFTNTMQPLGTYLTTSIELSDVDGDGDLDMVEGNSGQPDRVWINQGVNSGNFVDTWQTPVSYVTTSVKLGDMDDDGDTDMVTGNNTPHGVLWLNNGDGTFDETETMTGSGALAMELGDVDGDGDLDVIIDNHVSPSSSNINIWVNDY